jgi:diketogulonate reductase-like aldo/keto reductase
VISAPIVGARKAIHLDDAIASLDIELTDDEVAELEAGYTRQPQTVTGAGSLTGDQLTQHQSHSFPAMCHT